MGHMITLVGMSEILDLLMESNFYWRMGYKSRMVEM